MASTTFSSNFCNRSFALKDLSIHQGDDIQLQGPWKIEPHLPLIPMSYFLVLVKFVNLTTVKSAHLYQPNQMQAVFSSIWPIRAYHNCLVQRCHNHSAVFII